MRTHTIKCDRCEKEQTVSDGSTTPDGWISVDALDGGMLGVENKSTKKGINYTNAFRGHHWCSPTCIVKWFFGSSADITFNDPIK
jgi:hypothetical protein